MTKKTSEPSARIISPKADKLLRRMTTSAAVVVGLFAAVMSFAGLRAWGVEHGLHPTLAFALPLIIDGMMLSAALFYSHASLRGRRSGPAFITLAGGVGLSIYGNVSHGWTGSIDGIFVHAAAPVALLVSLEFALSLMRKRLTDEAVQEEAERAAEAKALRAQERAQAKASNASVTTAMGVRAPASLSVPASTSKPSRKPAKRVQPARTDLNEARITEVSALIATQDFVTATANMTNPQIAAHVLASVPGVTVSEAVKAGVMAQADDKGRTHYYRVQKAFKKAEERVVEGTPVTTPVTAPQRSLKRVEAPGAPAPVSSESMTPERVLTAVGAR